MGFELRRTVTLAFEGQYAGLEVRCSAAVPLRRALAITRTLAEAGDDPDGFERAFRQWVEAVQPEWNAEVDGEPVPCTADAILDWLPADIVVNMIPAWRQAVTGLDPTSPAVSASGEQPPAAPIPTLASLSSALPN